MFSVVVAMDLAHLPASLEVETKPQESVEFWVIKIKIIKKISKKKKKKNRVWQI